MQGVCELATKGTKSLSTDSLSNVAQASSQDLISAARAVRSGGWRVSFDRDTVAQHRNDDNNPINLNATDRARECPSKHLPRKSSPPATPNGVSSRSLESSRAKVGARGSFDLTGSTVSPETA